MKKYFLLLTVLIAVNATAADAAVENNGSEVNSILASVNGKAISLHDILPLTRTKEFQAYAVYSGKRLEEVIRELRKKAVDELIDRELILSAYRKQSYRIANSDIEHELDLAAVRMGCRSRDDFRRRLAESHIDPADFRRELEERMIVHFMYQRQIAIDGGPTPQEIYEFFERNRTELGGKESYELAMLKLEASLPADEIRFTEETLKRDPGAFESLVQRFNPGSGDGSLGRIEPDKLRMEFSGLLKVPVEGKVYGPLKLDDATVWLKLLKHNRPAKVDFEQIQSRITGILEEKKRQKAIEVYNNMLRRDAVLKYYF